jgi:hypothetical protein
MRFDFFESLSRDEAAAFLERFRTVESVHLDDLLKHCLSEGVYSDFSIDSIAPFMRWIVTKLKTFPKTPDWELPTWIRYTDSYAKNLFEFDDGSKLLTLRAAYYFGESFVKSHRSLVWTIGNPETAEANMPVVAGFRFGLEMAPILIAENLFRRVIAEPLKLSDIDKAVDYWNQKL